MEEREKKEKKTERRELTAKERRAENARLTKISQDRVKGQIKKMMSGKLVSVQIPQCMLAEFKKKKRSNLEVATIAKALLKYVMQVTENVPKKYRYTHVNRLQNYAISILDNIVRASQYRKDVKESLARRRDHQRDACTEVRMLSYMSLVAYECKVLQFKHYVHIGERCNYLLERLRVWMAE